MTSTLHVEAGLATFMTGAGCGYVTTMILQKIGKIVLTLIALIFGGLLALLLFLQHVGVIYVFWSRLLEWIIGIIIGILRWLSMNVLELSTTAGIFSTGFMVGSILRIAHRGEVGRVRRRMFKIRS